MRSKMRFFVSLILMAAVLQTSVSFTFGRFEEGMFTPDQIAKLPLAKKGLKIRPIDIYNPNGVSLADAVVRLSIGCSAEFVSPDGLILTNHHCAYDALVAASTPQMNYGELGYKADSRANELQAKDYQVFLPERNEDVTVKITAGTENLTGDAKDQAIKKNVDDLQKAEQAKAPAGSTVRIQNLNNGFYYYLYQTKAIKDIRVVYAPPYNIGQFGGDPDNFEWTRHGGDFTFLRAYVAPDGSSAEYSPNNVPYKPKKFLTINANGLKDNDFTFILGYPGSTVRYRESQQIDFAQNVNYPFIVNYLSAQADALEEIGKDDEAKRVKLQGDVFSLRNSIKAYDGGVKAMKRANIVTQRKADEAKLSAWINANPARRTKYGNMLADFSSIYQSYYTTSARDRILRTLPGAATPAAQTPMPVFKLVFDAAQAVQKGTSLTDAKREEIQAVYKEREPVVEREMIKYFLQALAELPANQKFAPVENIFARFKGKDRRSAEETFAESIAEKDFTTPESIYTLYNLKPADFQKKYLNIYNFMNELAAEQGNIAVRLQRFGAEANRLRLLYIEAMSEMKGQKAYPDANSSLRFTYGNISGYKPREAVTYAPFTSLKGVIEKDTGVAPFDVPQKLKDLQRTRDFGRYGLGDSVPVNFLSTNDIIGGNSGSPVMNAYGELIGVAFDGNYEGLGNDIFFNPDYGRTINVDIRYVLFVTEKFGGAGWILNELKFAPARRAMPARAR